MKQLPITFTSEYTRNRRNSKVGHYLDGNLPPYSINSANIIKVAPAPDKKISQPLVHKNITDGHIYKILKPALYLQKIMGIHPIGRSKNGCFEVKSQLLMYSALVFLVEVALIGYFKWDKVKIVKSSEAEARFEEAVIDYLFTVYLIPIVINPITLYEAKYHAKIMEDFKKFELSYTKVVKKKLNIFMGNKPLLMTIALPTISCATMVINHVTMVNFSFVQVIPYCYINTVTYLIGGLWYAYSEVIGKIALTISQDFQFALKNMSTSSKIAEFRSLWMILAKITRDCGNSSGHTLLFLCLYLFLIITLTIYGLFSQIQGGLETKDIGLTITALFAIALLYFICDEAHYASNCVKVHFQKRLLLVELTWMNEDSQQEINMFLRATEMNPTNMSLVGFFDVNRNLFKSLLATMVTYLVVLLQFQISIPEDTGSSNSPTNGTLI